jgi:hypothetical protein
MLWYYIFVYIIDLKEYSFPFYGLYKWMHRSQHSFKKIPSNLVVVCIGSNSFQGISYAGKPQVASSYSFKSMWYTLSYDLDNPKNSVSSLRMTTFTINSLAERHNLAKLQKYIVLLLYGMSLCYASLGWVSWRQHWNVSLCSEPPKYHKIQWDAFSNKA